MFWLVKIWRLSWCGKFIQRLETCLLELTEFCVILWYFKLSFSTWCTKWNTAAIKIVLRKNKYCLPETWWEKVCLKGWFTRHQIQLLSRLFCNSWLVCLLRFLLTNALLVKVIENPISDDIVFKNELTHLPLLEVQEGWKVSSDSGTFDDLQKQHPDW